MYVRFLAISINYEGENPSRWPPRGKAGIYLHCAWPELVVGPGEVRQAYTYTVHGQNCNLMIAEYSIVI